MHRMHARTPKNFVLEERLERFSHGIELEPTHLAGHWADACQLLGTEGAEQPAYSHFDEVRLDLGCGKGAFICESARREPRVLFVGMDAEPLCIAYTAQAIVEQGLANAVVAPGAGTLVGRAFGAGELSCIHLNFPTPYPRKKEAAKRLVALERLLEYRDVLGEGGLVKLRTDSQPLRDFALTQLELAGYRVVWRTDDERLELPDEPGSEYERRLVAQGAHVFAVWATPGKLPEQIRQAAPQSLVDYLPDDLFGDGYIPYGMEGTVKNLRNQALRRQMRQ